MSSVRFTRILVLVLLLLSLIPLLWISFYNHSSADDYTYGYLTRDAWEQTHNFFSVLKAGAELVRLEYLTYQGSYAAMMLFSLQPAIYGEQFYFACTFILLGSLLFAVFFFCRVLIGEIFGSRQIADIAAGTVLLVSVQLIPFPCEAFFWWNGAVYYVFFYALLLIQCALFLRMLHRGRCSRGSWLLCGLLSVLLGGGNYITGLLAAEMCVLFSVTALVKKLCRKELLSVSGLYLLCFAVSALAPGNAVRKATVTQAPPLKAILLSYHYAYEMMIQWTVPLLVLALVFLFPFLWKACKTRLGSVKPLPLVLVLAVMFSAFASAFTPNLYAENSLGPGRVLNICFLFWVLLCVAAEMSAILTVQSILSRALAGQEEAMERVEGAFGRFFRPFLASVLLLACFFAANYIIIGDRNELTSVSAALSLADGSARRYDQALDSRMEILLSDAPTAELDPLTEEPYVLYMGDIYDDIHSWQNEHMARYFHKEWVKVK